MDVQIEHLLTALQQVNGGPPSDLLAFVEGLPAPAVLPAPWETWTLIGLVRHRNRQLWVADIVRTRLRGNLADLAAMGSLGHPEGEQGGSVPGMPEWKYYFHGRGCCITHKVTGEAIDVDFCDDSAEYFDTYFYTCYLDSLRSPEPVEQRLCELHQSLEPIRIAVDSLVRARALTPLSDGSSHPRVSDAVLAHTASIESFCNAWAILDQRLWLAALIGDWPAANELARGQPDVERITAPRAEECRQQRRTMLLRQTGYSAVDALYGLAEVNSADSALEGAFRGEPCGLVAVALEIITQRDDARWCSQVYALFKRLNPRGSIPEPHIWMASLKYMLRYGYHREELIDALADAGGTEIGEAIVLSLEHAPEHALLLIRKCLLSDIPMNRSMVAAILALIGRPWSTRELLRALEHSDNQEKTADARAAILQLGDPDAEKAVLAWEQNNPHEDEIGTYLEVNGRRIGPFYSLREHALKDRCSWIQYEMYKLRDRVMKVRDVVPPEPKNPV